MNVEISRPLENLGKESPKQDLPLEGEAQTDELAPIHVNEHQTTVRGIRKFILNHRLKRTDQELHDLQSELNTFSNGEGAVDANTRAKNDKLLYANMRLASNNWGLEQIHRVRAEGDSGVFTEDEKARKEYNKNMREIRKRLSRVKGSPEHLEATARKAQEAREKKRNLEAKLGLVSEQGEVGAETETGTPLGPISESFQTYSSPNRDPMKGQSRTEKALVTALNKLVEDRSVTLDDSSVKELLEGIDGADEKLARFTLKKLQGLRIIDREGKLIQSKGTLERHLGSLLSADQDRPRNPDEGARIVLSEGISLNNERLEVINNLVQRATANYIESEDQGTPQHFVRKNIRGIQDGVIRSFIGQDATTEDVERVKKAVADMLDRKSKLTMSTMTRTELANKRATVQRTVAPQPSSPVKTPMTEQEIAAMHARAATEKQFGIEI